MDPDDLPETFADSDEPPMDLTLSQELLMKSYLEQVERMSKEECDELSIDILRQSFAKDNILRMLGIKVPDDWLVPPDPGDFLDGSSDKPDLGKAGGGGGGPSGASPSRDGDDSRGGGLAGSSR